MQTHGHQPLAAPTQPQAQAPGHQLFPVSAPPAQIPGHQSYAAPTPPGHTFGPQASPQAHAGVPLQLPPQIYPTQPFQAPPPTFGVPSVQPPGVPPGFPNPRTNPPSVRPTYSLVSAARVNQGHTASTPPSLLGTGPNSQQAAPRAFDRTLTGFNCPASHCVKMTIAPNPTSPFPRSENEILRTLWQRRLGDFIPQIRNISALADGARTVVVILDAENTAWAFLATVDSLDSTGVPRYSLGIAFERWQTPEQWAAVRSQSAGRALLGEQRAVVVGQARLLASQIDCLAVDDPRRAQIQALLGGAAQFVEAPSGTFCPLSGSNSLTSPTEPASEKEKKTPAENAFHKITQLSIASLNIRGKAGSNGNELKKVLNSEKIDIIALQESLSADVSVKDFVW